MKAKRRRIDYAGLADLRGVQIARIFGVGGGTVTKWAARGCPRSATRRYSLAEVAAWLRGGGVTLERMRQEQVLQVLGVTRPTIGQWQQRGCPRNEDGSYDLAAVVQWRIAEIEERLAASRRIVAAGRARRETALAERAEIELCEMKGELLPRQAIVAGWVARYQVLRAQLMGLVRRISGRGIGEEQREQIEGDVREMLAELARGQPALRLSAEEAELLRDGNGVGKGEE